MKTSCSEPIGALLREFIKEVVGDYSMAGSRRYQAPGNIRSGMQVTGYRGNVLSDENYENEKAALRPTVRVLVSRSDGKVLAVVDPQDSFHIGLPGGGVEPGESVEEAAGRELWEETGLKSESIVKLGEHFINIGPVTLFRVNKVSGRLRSSHEGDVIWVDPLTLLDGKFGDYYREAFRDIGFL